MTSRATIREALLSVGKRILLLNRDARMSSFPKVPLETEACYHLLERVTGPLHCEKF